MITLQQRDFLENFLIVTELSDDEEKLLLDFEQARTIQNYSIQLIKGEISPEDYLDAVESSVPIDDYIDEICDNIEIFLGNDNYGRHWTMG